MPGPIWLAAVATFLLPAAVAFIVYEIVRARREQPTNQPETETQR